MIKLRAFRRQDAKQYYEIAKDKRCYFPFSFCKDMSEAEFVIDTYLNCDDLEAYAIIKGDTLIGAIYAEKSHKEDSIDVSYFIGEQYQRKGYVTEAIKELEKKLQTKQIKHIGFFIDQDNIASIKTATKYGAVLKRKATGNLSYYQKEI